jgi:hypothetical protein
MKEIKEKGDMREGIKEKDGKGFKKKTKKVNNERKKESL